MMSRQQRHLTMIDRTTRWPVVVPLSSISTEACVNAFILAWISSFGVPATLTSDIGAQFTSSVWTAVCHSLGISTSQTTSFHPQSNGMIELFHRSLKSSLRARADDSHWVSHLPLVLLGLRSVPKEDTGFSVSEAVYGSALTIPGEFLDAPELPNSQFINKIRKVIAGFSTPPPHHVQHLPPTESLSSYKRMQVSRHLHACTVVLILHAVHKYPAASQIPHKQVSIEHRLN